jgi:hypothetical protein
MKMKKVRRMQEDPPLLPCQSKFTMEFLLLAKTRNVDSLKLLLHNRTTHISQIENATTTRVVHPHHLLFCSTK